MTDNGLKDIRKLLGNAVFRFLLEVLGGASIEILIRG